MSKEARDIAGTTVSFERHGNRDRDTVFLVHCGGGHSGWWSLIAPMLAETHHVVTLDLSGHGDSARRPEYHPTYWAEEVGALIREITPGQKVSLVGHSLGGLVSIYTAAMTPELVAKLVVIDPPVLHVRARDTALASRTYERQEDAFARFNLRPPETTASRDRLLEVAMQGLAQGPDGWTWKYDPKASQRFTVEGVAAELAQVKCPVHCIYGEKSPYVDEETVRYMGKVAGRAVPSTMIPNAYHHVPLDAPAEVAQAIEAALAVDA